jgi:hypothetical protein
VPVEEVMQNEVSFVEHTELIYELKKEFRDKKKQCGLKTKLNT